MMRGILLVFAVVLAFVSADNYPPIPPDPFCPAGCGHTWNGFNLCSSPRANAYLLVAQCVTHGSTVDVITRIAGSNDPNYDACGGDPTRANVEQTVLNLNDAGTNVYLISQFCQSGSGPLNFVTRVETAPFFFAPNPCSGDPNRLETPSSGEPPKLNFLSNGYNVLHWSMCQSTQPGGEYDRITRIITDNDFTGKNICDPNRSEVERGTINISAAVLQACSVSGCPQGATCNYQAGRDYLSCWY